MKGPLATIKGYAAQVQSDRRRIWMLSFEITWLEVNHANYSFSEDEALELKAPVEQPI